MTAPARREPLSAPSSELERVMDLLGGERLLRRRLRSSLDAHELLLRGLPGPSLDHLLDSLVVLQRTASLEKAIGISLRTLQRRREAPSKPLSREQSARAWKFAEILAMAIEVFGSQEEAEQWLERPALGLEQRRPIDLISTPAGLELVEDHLERLQYGVYT